MSSLQLAIRGGPKTILAGPPAWPTLDRDVLDALEDAYADGSWGRYDGRHGERLAAALSEFHGVAHTLLCSSGTFAVELGLRALKIAEGDEVILAGYDFGGNFRCIEAVGARPVLVDIDPGTWCLAATRVEDAIGRRTRAIVVSHLHGGIADMRTIMDVASRRGLVVVEDACQSPGATVQRKVAGTWGDVGVLSFGGSKLLTAGRGGALVTSRADVFQRAKIYCERGNHAFPLSELQAAVLLPQLEKLGARNQTRAENADYLKSLCRDIPEIRCVENSLDDCKAGYYKVGFMIGSIREAFIAAIQAEGVAMDAGFRGFGRRSTRRCRTATDLTYAQDASIGTLVLHHPVLLEPQETVALVASAIRKVAPALQSEMK